MRYRRAWIAGGSFFFTVVTAERRPLLASVEAVNVLRLAFRAVRARYPFEVDAMVALPDHLHCIWSLPADDADFATRWRLIKTWLPSITIRPCARRRTPPNQRNGNSRNSCYGSIDIRSTRFATRLIATGIRITFISIP